MDSKEWQSGTPVDPIDLSRFARDNAYGIGRRPGPRSRSPGFIRRHEHAV